MQKFLVKGRYTQTGVQGIVKDGGSARVKAVEQMVGELGGKVEAFYFAFGKDDVFVIADLPDNTTAAAVALAVGASGALGLETVTLLTPEEVDRASQHAVNFRPPGQ